MNKNALNHILIAGQDFTQSSANSSAQPSANSSTPLLTEPSTEVTVTVDYPRPDRLLRGQPRRETHQFYQHPHMDCGIWHCEVGAWRIVFAHNKQEFFQVIQGLVRIHDAQGQFIDVGAGQAGIIPPGFEGVFEVIEPVQKYYVNVMV